MELQTHARKKYPTSALLRSSAGLGRLQAHRQEDLRYPQSTLLKSSNDLGWSTLFAEHRSHSRYEGPGAAPPTDTDVGIVVRGFRRRIRDVQIRRKLAPSAADNGLDLVEADRTQVRQGPSLGERGGCRGAKVAAGDFRSLPTQ